MVLLDDPVSCLFTHIFHHLLLQSSTHITNRGWNIMQDICVFQEPIPESPLGYMCLHIEDGTIALNVPGEYQSMFLSFLGDVPDSLTRFRCS